VYTSYSWAGDGVMWPLVSFMYAPRRGDSGEARWPSVMGPRAAEAPVGSKSPVTGADSKGYRDE
jgi:hypothetical protein